MDASLPVLKKKKKRKENIENPQYMKYKQRFNGALRTGFLGVENEWKKRRHRTLLIIYMKRKDDRISAEELADYDVFFRFDMILSI